MQPNQSPAFQFYPKDWMSSTSVLCMSLLEQGAYLRLLCCDWLNDGIPSDPEELSKMSGLDEGWFNGSSTRLLKCFEPHPTKVGFLRNPRLQKERKRQEEWRQKSREGGIKSGKARQKPSKKAPDEPPLKHPMKQTPTKDEPKGNFPFPSPFPSPSPEEVLQIAQVSPQNIGGGMGEPASEDVAPLLGEGVSPDKVPETAKPKAKPKAIPEKLPHDRRAVSDAWVLRFKQHTGSDYAFNGAKDGKAISDLLAVVPADKIIETIHSAFDTATQNHQGAFWLKKLSSLPMFTSRYNEIRHEITELSRTIPKNTMNQGVHLQASQREWSKQIKINLEEQRRKGIEMVEHLKAERLKASQQPPTPNEP